MVTWLTAPNTALPTAKYPAMVITAAGKAIGAVTIVVLIAARISPMLRSFLKNFGVGAAALSIIVIQQLLHCGFSLSRDLLQLCLKIPVRFCPGIYTSSPGAYQKRFSISF